MKVKRIVIVCILLCSVATAQSRMVEPGPFGTPLMVADEGGTMQTAILIYEDADVAYVIPDITSAGWRAWFLPGFRRDGKYPVRIYEWFKTNKVCMGWEHPAGQNGQWAVLCSELGYQYVDIISDVRNQSVNLGISMLIDKSGVPNIGSPNAIRRDREVSKVPKPFRITVQRINKMVENESKGGWGR